jgi:hypothetical protein
VIGNVLYLRLGTDLGARFWGTAGLLGVIAFFVAAVSFDSFAIPNMWVVFGLGTAASWVFSKEAQGEKQPAPSATSALP